MQPFSSHTVLADVLENAFCLYCINQTLRRGGNKIAPSDVSVVTSNLPRKSLTKRSSSVYSLVQDLKNGSTNEEKRGTLLFIAAILLQRELVETMVPVQAILILSLNVR